MVAHINTIAFQGLKTETIDVQVHIGDGLPAFQIVGLADKAVSEAKERVRASLHAVGLSLPPKRITINLSPADMVKEGSHYDLPIALGLLTAMDILPMEKMLDYVVMGELALDGVLVKVAGALPGAVHANAMDKTFICPEGVGGEAMWAGGDSNVLAPNNLIELINHIKGDSILPPPKRNEPDDAWSTSDDLQDIRGQESAKRALEIAAVGGHNMLMMGPPGSGKSMLASRLPTILPPLEPREALDVSVIYSVSGMLQDGAIARSRPFRAPHFGASAPALIGGGAKAKPGEISLAHHGVLFLDELPEFPRASLEALRQPIETGDVVISRANAHITYPASFQLIGAMNPCRCGDVDSIHSFCKRGRKCSEDYQARISGPMYDRFDMFVEVPAVSIEDLSLPKSADSSRDVLQRVIKSRNFAQARFKEMGLENIYTNAKISGDALEKMTMLNDDCRTLITKASTTLKLTARAYHRVLKVARTIADLEQSVTIEKHHLAEALSYRRKSPTQ